MYRKASAQKILLDEQTRNEIDRYKWIESEKAGCDIGFDRAVEEWMKQYGKNLEKKEKKKKVKVS
ncbi:MAG: hypothetical protein KAJ18_02835 [Candidatus Omnitrophica bacterium]|nr:hypothetical protein [Candidatus Omnitrophota bacterium]